MGKYKGYSNHGGNHHLRTDMDHEWRLIDDAKGAIYDEDRDLRDKKSAAHEDGVNVEDTKSKDALTTGEEKEQVGHIPEEDYDTK